MTPRVELRLHSSEFKFKLLVSVYIQSSNFIGLPMLLTPARGPGMHRSGLSILFLSRWVYSRFVGTPRMMGNIWLRPSGITWTQGFIGETRNEPRAEEMHMIHKLVHDVLFVLEEGRRVRIEEAFLHPSKKDPALPQKRH